MIKDREKTREKNEIWSQSSVFQMEANNLKIKLIIMGTDSSILQRNGSKHLSEERYQLS